MLPDIVIVVSVVIVVSWMVGMPKCINVDPVTCTEEKIHFPIKSAVEGPEGPVVDWEHPHIMTAVTRATRVKTLLRFILTPF